ncbi:hypothetical protein ACTFIU_008495 [Dictyostelium citrinum]
MIADFLKKFNKINKKQKFRVGCNVNHQKILEKLHSSITDSIKSLEESKKEIEKEILLLKENNNNNSNNNNNNKEKKRKRDDEIIEKSILSTSVDNEKRQNKEVGGIEKKKMEGNKYEHVLIEKFDYKSVRQERERIEQERKETERKQKEKDAEELLNFKDFEYITIYTEEQERKKAERKKAEEKAKSNTKDSKLF